MSRVASNYVGDPDYMQLSTTQFILLEEIVVILLLKIFIEEDILLGRQCSDTEKEIQPTQ